MGRLVNILRSAPPAAWIGMLLVAAWCAPARADDIYLCEKPAEGNAGALTVVRPGQACPAGLRRGGALAIEFELAEPAPLHLAAVYASSTDNFNLPDDLEVYVNDESTPRIIMDAVPYGEHNGGELKLGIAPEWLRAGPNRVTLSLRRVDFVGFGVTLGSLRLSTGLGDAEAQAALKAGRERVSWHVERGERISRELRRILTTATYRVAVEDGLHKLFQDELELVLKECTAAESGAPWSLRSSRLTGNFVPSLLRTEAPWSAHAEAAAPPLRLEMCRHERESGQVVVVPCTADLAGVSIACSDLAGPGGAVISAQNVEVRIVGYVRTTPCRYQVEYLGWWPDPLLPNFPVDCYVGQVQPVWVTVYAPPDARPGDYRGTVRVAPAGLPAVEVPLEVHVWDFRLPVEPFLQTAIDLGDGWIQSFYARHPEANAGGLGREAIRRNFLRAFLEHRMSCFNPGSGFTGEAYDRLMEFAFEHGQTRFSATEAYTNDLAKVEFQERQIALMAHLVRKGWYDRSYYYGIDEGYGNIPLIYGLAKRMLPGVRTLTTTTHSESLEPILDIFVPRTVNDWGAYYDRGVPERLAGLGKEYWVYTSGFPAPPVWPQVYVDCPAVDQRIIPWTCARWGMTGYLKVPITSWYHMESVRMDYTQVRTPWDVNPGIYGNSNGEILMTYCGPAGEMMPSTRLEALRDGIEDYDYFMILRHYSRRLAEAEGAEAAAARQAVDAALDLSDIVPRPYQFPRRPYAGQLLERRRRLAEAIVQAKRALGATEDPVPDPPPSLREGPIWCAATQPEVNNVRPQLVSITLVNQSGAPLAGRLRAEGPKGWKLAPDRWEGVQLDVAGLRRIETEVLLDDAEDTVQGEVAINLSMEAGAEEHGFSLPLRGVLCRGFRVVGPFEPKLTVMGAEPLPPEQEIKPAYGEMTWREIALPLGQMNIDFDHIYGTPATKYVPQDPQENLGKTAFALSYIHTDRQRTLTLRLGGENRTRAWLGGKSVFGALQAELGAQGGEGLDLFGPSEGDATYLFDGKPEVTGPAQREVSLKPGWNELLVSVEKSIGRQVGDWSLSISLHEGDEPADELLWKPHPSLAEMPEGSE